MKIVFFGELLIDMTPTYRQDNYTANPGGAPCNAAVAAAKYGAKACYIGKVGDDIMGRLMLDTLRKNDVDVSGVIADSRENTTLAFVKLENGERSFSFYRLADCRIKPEEVNLNLLEDAGIFHFGSLALTNQPVKDSLELALKTAVENGAKISFDVNYRDTLWDSPDRAKKEIGGVIESVDLLKVSEEELEFLTGVSDIEKGAAKFLERGVGSVTVSLGAKGSAYFSEGIAVYAPSFKVKPVDTTGAGDAFWGTFLAITAEESPELKPDYEHIFRKLRISNAAGAAAATEFGGIPSVLSRERLEDFIKKNGGI